MLSWFTTFSLHVYLPLHIDCLLFRFLLFLRFNLFYSLNQSSYLIKFLWLFLCATSKSLLRKDEVSCLGIFAFLDRIKHVVLDGVLALKLKDKTVLKFIDLFSVRVRKLKLSMGLLNFFTDCFKAFSRHHESLSSHDKLFWVFINGEIIFDLIFLFFEVLLELFVIFCSHGYHHSRLALVLVTGTVYTVELFIFNINHWEIACILMDLTLKTFLHYKKHFWQVFHCIRDDIVDKFIVSPDESFFDILEGGGSSLWGILGCSWGKFIQIWSYYLMQCFFFQLHLSEDNFMSLSFFDYLCIFVEEMHRRGLSDFWVSYLEHLAIVLFHRNVKLSL